MELLCFCVLPSWKLAVDFKHGCLSIYGTIKLFFRMFNPFKYKVICITTACRSL